MSGLGAFTTLSDLSREHNIRYHTLRRRLHAANIPGLVRVGYGLLIPIKHAKKLCYEGKTRKGAAKKK